MLTAPGDSFDWVASSRVEACLYLNLTAILVSDRTLVFQTIFNTTTTVCKLSMGGQVSLVSLPSLVSHYAMIWIVVHIAHP